MPRVSDEDALIAFKDAFGVQHKVQKKDAAIRLGKISIGLEEFKRAIQFAVECGMSRDSVGRLMDEYHRLHDLMLAHGQSAQPDMQELEALKQRARFLENGLQEKIAKVNLPTLQGSGICSFDVPGIDKMNSQQRNAKIDEIRGKACRGAAFAQGVWTGDPRYTAGGPTKETVADMCWYLKGMAQRKLGKPYQEGAMTLPDPGGALAKFFDNCPDAYPRKSSHLRPEQEKVGSQGRGIDIPGGFPGDLNTVLWHPYVTDDGEHRIYVKFETAGSHKFVDEGKREVARRPANENDAKEAWQHTLSFVGLGKKPKVRKELAQDTREGTINCAVLNAYQDIVKACPKYSAILERDKQVSKQNSEGKVTGASRMKSFIPALANGYWDVKTQNKNLFDAIQQMTVNDGEFLESIFSLVTAWQKAMTEAGYLEETELRIGDEVTLVTGDLKMVAHGTDGDFDDDHAFISMLDLCRRQVALQKAMLTGNKDNLLFTYYTKISFADPAGNRQPRIEFPDLILFDTHAPQFVEFFDDPSHQPVMGSIKKSISTFSRSKKFEFTGALSQQAMFRALQRTGWDMANLKTPADLIKNG